MTQGCNHVHCPTSKPSSRYYRKVISISSWRRLLVEADSAAAVVQAEAGVVVVVEVEDLDSVLFGRDWLNHLAHSSSLPRSP